MKLLLFDNYDSFTYNLYHIIREQGIDADVRRNNEITLDEIDSYDKILLSPGPGIPSEAGILLPLLKRYASTKSILGVCLGEQAIGECFGATLTNLKRVHHGIASTIKVVSDGEPIFKGLGNEFTAGRYHSWIVSRENFPAELEITATDSEGEIMALRHRNYCVRGIQFHPESILTPQGAIIIKNWIEL